jgi:hypothetical protein
MTDDRSLVDYDDGQLAQYEDVGSDVREAYERHRTSHDVIEHEDNRPLTEVIRRRSRLRQEQG